MVGNPASFQVQQKINNQIFEFLTSLWFVIRLHDASRLERILCRPWRWSTLSGGPMYQKCPIGRVLLVRASCLRKDNTVSQYDDDENRIHGGGKKCAQEGCEKRAQSGGHCSTHGGGRRCARVGCDKGVQYRGLCYAHGGFRVCEQCPKRVVRGSKWCSTHRPQFSPRSQPRKHSTSPCESMAPLPLGPPQPVMRPHVQDRHDSALTSRSYPTPAPPRVKPVIMSMSSVLPPLWSVVSSTTLFSSTVSSEAPQHRSR